MTSPVDRDSCVRILFLGQCLQYGYEDVDAASTFVALAARGLAARFPALRIRLDRKHLYHPRGLRAILRHRLGLAPPDIVVIGVVGLFAASPTRVSLLYELAPEVVDTARSFLQKIEAKRSGRATVRADTPLDGLMAWHPPLGLDEYERLIEEGVELCQRRGSRVLLLGPGRFNEDTTDTFDGVTPALWLQVNEMVRRVATRFAVASVDALGALSEHDGGVFLPKNLRWSRFGHRVVAREVEEALAAEIAAFELANSRG